METTPLVPSLEEQHGGGEGGGGMGPETYFIFHLLFYQVTSMGTFAKQFSAEYMRSYVKAPELKLFLIIFLISSAVRVSNILSGPHAAKQ